MTNGSEACESCKNGTSTKDAYFQYLVSLVQDRDHTHFLVLLKLLHQKAFYWTNPNDENRASDGYTLRNTFWNTLCESGLNLAKDDKGAYIYSYDALQGPCSVLEMLVGFAERIEAMVPNGDRNGHGWFWVMLDNLDLLDCDDAHIDEDKMEKVNLKLQIALDRKYDQHGRGGFWPMIQARRDQRDLELWFQACDWIAENVEV